MISFKGRHHCREIILMSIRWYLAYALSYRDIEELLLERHALEDRLDHHLTPGEVGHGQRRRQCHHY